MSNSKFKEGISKLPWRFHETDDRYCIVASDNSIVVYGYKTPTTKKDFELIINNVNYGDR